MTRSNSKARTALLLTLCTIVLNVSFAYAFSDIKPDAWYYKYVKYLEDRKISAGYADGTYRPNQTVSAAESLVFFIKALEIPIKSESTSDESKSSSETPDDSAVDGTTLFDKTISNEAVSFQSHWAYNYIITAAEKNALTPSFVPDDLITRGEAANIIYTLLGFSQEKEGGSQQAKIFKDVNAVEVNKLYELGIFEGYLETGGLFFKPDNKLTRAELAVVVNKLCDYKSRTVGDFTIMPLISTAEMTYVKYPETVEDFESMFLSMAVNEEFKKTISYSATYKDKIKDETLRDAASEAFANLYSTYPEFFSFTNGIETSGAYGSLTNQMTFVISSNDFTDNEVTKMRTSFFKEADEILRGLINEGRLTADMTDREKARVLYEWMALNNEYDLDFNRESFNGYGASHYQKAVCQGYTALYNALCKMAGIKVQGIAGKAIGINSKDEGHMWTLAVLDGEKVHVDATFGDPVPDAAGRCNFDYFAVSSDFISKNHSWDKEKYGI